MRLALAAVLLAASACAPGAPAPSPAPSGGHATIVDGTAETLREMIRSSDGRPVVVNYWASWCVPCIDEMPRFVAAARSYDGRVDFIGVNVEDSRRSAEQFARRFRIPFRSVFDPRGTIRRDQKVLGLPATHFFRADGQLGFVHSGEIQASELETKLREIVRAA